MLQPPADVAGQRLHGLDLRLGPGLARTGPQQGQAAEQFLAGPERREQQRRGALAEQDLPDLGRDLLGLRGVQVLYPVARPVPVDLAYPADRVRWQVADRVAGVTPAAVTPAAGVTVGEGEPLPGDDTDPDEVHGQVLVDRGDRLRDDRIGAQVLADPDGEFETRLASFCAAQTGPAAMLWGDHAGLGGRAARAVCYAPAYTVMGGTVSILRNVLAERVLGLPR